MDSIRKKELEKFLDNIGIKVYQLDLINESLTHRSFVNEQKKISKLKNEYTVYNQRLEFLGDAVLGLVISKALFHRFSDENEGDLTKRKAMAVCAPTLSEIAEKIGIGHYLLMGKGEVQSGGSRKSSNIADALESLIGAIYLGSEFDNVEKFILKYWEPYLLGGKVAEYSVDYKSNLQEYLMKRGKYLPEYRVVSTSGPEHEKMFEVALFLAGKEIIRSVDTSRKKAEQKAAYQYMLNKHLV